MFPPAIDIQPSAYIEQLGSVFACFDSSTQDSGNVCYGVDAGEGRRYFVKTAGDPTAGEPYLDFEGRAKLLRTAAQLADDVQHPVLPTFHGLVESPGGPVLIYDWRDGDHLRAQRHLADDPGTAFNRFRALPVEQIVDALDEVFDVHRLLDAKGWVPGDFYDGCLLYDFDKCRLTVVDLDCYRPAPHRNDMGRMFGSTRFMAPEEFSLGAPIDGRTTAFVMARTMLVYLSDGTLTRDAFRGSDAVYAVAQEAVTTRFPSYTAFHEAWIAART